MKYGKLIDGVLIYAPNPLSHNGMRIYNPSGDLYVAEGYAPIIETSAPESTEDSVVYYAPTWEMQANQIVKVWIETEPPVEEIEVAPSPTLDERVAAVESAILAIMGGV